MRSIGTRFLTVGLLALFMFIPLFFVGAIIDERAEYSRATASELGLEWGGAQVLTGPELVIPVTEMVTQTEREEIIDPVTGAQLLDAAGRVRTRLVETQREVPRAAFFLLPEAYNAAFTVESDERRRGIFRVPVYRARLAADFTFDLDQLEVSDGQTIHWEQAELRFGLSSNRALRGRAELRAGDDVLKIEPWARQHAGGLLAAIGDPRTRDGYALNLAFQGSERLALTPMGRTSTIRMDSDWPHPSFTGAFLPDASEISDAGFQASWTIPHLARSLPQVARESQISRSAKSAFGVRFFQPNDFYKMAYRASRYGILFIALTFLSVLLIERGTSSPAHPVQYLMIGLVQGMFVVLMVAYAEQIGFAAAYALAATATVGLITIYGAVGLGLGRKTIVLGAMLALLYGVLYLILRSTDYALLAGSTLVFAALAAAMLGTRNETWYGEAGPGEGLRMFRRRSPPARSGEGSF
ncbi:MAG: cell envelope integrity protein CreD [Pseudomonadota bacterium]